MRALRVMIACVAVTLAAAAQTHAIPDRYETPNTPADLAGPQAAASIVFYELTGFDHQVDWSRGSALRDTLRGRAATDDHLRQVATALEGPCAANSDAVTCPRWQMHRRTGRYDPDNVHEVHNPPTPWGSGGVLSDGVAVAYNVRVWREGHPQPIFERRIGLASGGDTDRRVGAAHQSLWNWWRGGAAAFGLAFGIGAQKGPLTRMDDAGAEAAGGRSRCRDRLAGARNPAVNLDSGTRVLPHDYLTLREQPSDQWGATAWCYWESTTMTSPARRWSNGPGQQLTESLFMRWRLPRAGAPASVEYILTGAPRTFYAVQIVAVDNRERLLGGAAGRGVLTGNEQYFRVFEPSVADIDQASRPQPEPPLNVGFDAPLTAVTRSLTRPVISTRASLAVRAGPHAAAGQQATFVRAAVLQHLSSNLDHNGARDAGGYDPGYVRYGDPYRVAPTAVPAPGSGGRPGAGQFMNMAQIDQAPRGDDLLGAATRNTYPMAWQRPTLINPCGRTLPRLTGQWPRRSEVCTSAAGSRVAELRNAWDDLLNPTVTWEARWVGHSPDRVEIGLVDADNQLSDTDSNNPRPASRRHVGQALRCDDRLTRPGSGRYGETGRPIVDCADPIHELADLPGRQTQTANGYLYAQGPDGGDAAVNVALLTNRPWLVSPPVVRSRDRSGEVPEAARSVSGRLNTWTGQPELYFCKPGPPTDTHLYGSERPVSKAAAGDDLSAADTDAYGRDMTRRDCQGWAVRWVWDPWDPWVYDLNDEAANTCKLFAPPPQGPEANLQLDRWPADTDIYGGRGSYKTIADIPYAGRKPGERYRNTEPCHALLPGHYSGGTWRYQYAWRVAPNTPGYCRWSSQAAALAALRSAGEGSHVGYATRCGAERRAPWRLGWAYRAGATIDWDETSCSFATETEDDVYVVDPQSATEHRRPLGDTPGRPGGLGVNAFLAAGSQRPQVVMRACIDRLDGHVLTGRWEITPQHRYAPGYGWGVNRTGPRLPAGGYHVTFPFEPMPGPDAAGVRWEMRAAYEGHREWNWRTNYRVNDPAETLHAVSVYAPRATR